MEASIFPTMTSALGRLPRPRHIIVPRLAHAGKAAVCGCGRKLGMARPTDTPELLRDECPTCHPAPTGRTWELRYPAGYIPLSLNDNDNRWKKAQRIRTWRNTTTILALQARIPALTRMAVHLYYAPRVRRRSDPLNLVATVKAVEDGLVDYNAVPDDTDRWVCSPPPVISEPDGRGSVWIVVEDLPPHRG